MIKSIKQFLYKHSRTSFNQINTGVSIFCLDLEDQRVRVGIIESVDWDVLTIYIPSIDRKAIVKYDNSRKDWVIDTKLSGPE